MSKELFESLKITEMMLEQSSEIRQFHSASVMIALEQANKAKESCLTNEDIIKNIGDAMHTCSCVAEN